jgi:hypothetical protein
MIWFPWVWVEIRRWSLRTCSLSRAVRKTHRINGYLWCYSWWTMMVLWWCSCDSIGANIWSCGFNWGLSITWFYLMLKSWWLTKNAKRSKPCLPFWASWTPCYACGVWNVLTFVYFSILWKNPGWVPDCQRSEEFRLVINQSVVPVEWSLHLKIGVAFLLIAI